MEIQRGNPQLENGYTNTANELVDQFQKLHLSGNEWQIVWTVLRKTYGWHKKSDAISISQFQKATGLSRPRVCEALRELVRKSVLLCNKEKYVTIWSFNKNYSQWTSTEKRTSLNDGKVSTEKRTTPVRKSVPKLVRKSVPTKENKETNTKETILSKDNIHAKRERDVNIDFILTAFYDYAGHRPLDRQPRNIAQVFKRQIQKLIKDLAPYKALTFEDIVRNSFSWYSRENDGVQAKYLNTVRKNITEILFESTRRKYITNST